MLIPNPQVFLAQLVTFAIGMAAVWFIYLKPLGEHLRQRKQGIAKDLASAEAARGEAEALRAQLAEERGRMADELRKAKEEAKADVARLREELMKKAEAEQAQLLKQGRAQIQAETEAALVAVRAEAADLVVQAAGAFLLKKPDTAVDKALAEQLVAAVKATKR